MDGGSYVRTKFKDQRGSSQVEGKKHAFKYGNNHMESLEHSHAFKSFTSNTEYNPMPQMNYEHQKEEETEEFSQFDYTNNRDQSDGEVVMSPSFIKQN